MASAIPYQQGDMMNKLVKSSILLLLILLTLVAIWPTKIQAYETNDEVEEVRTLFKEELLCLAENIYYEAASESYEGKLAVAQVTINRANSGKFPPSICGVVKQRTGKICQFSWVCDKSYSPKDSYKWEESLHVARKALTSPTAHTLLKKTNAMFYHADYVNPKWRKQRVAQIGRHIFYRT